MQQLMDWVERIVVVFLFLSTFIYLIPSKTYQKYIRFFAEMVLVITIFLPILSFVMEWKSASFQKNYDVIIQELNKRQEEAENFTYLDKDYIIYGFGEKNNAFDE